MPTAIAKLKNMQIAPRKARLVAGLIRGKRVADARDILLFCIKGSAGPIRKLLDSAVANAEHEAREKRQRIDTDDMVVSWITVNEGRTLYRFQSMPRGRAGKVRHRSSHVELVITDK